MLSVLVLLSALGMDIVCGWQPMPDGSASYECVIQVEPEVIRKLNRGDELPLSVDIPESVRPISRIRVVVGSGQLPQQTLVTTYQPVTQALAVAEESPGKKSRAGLIETQYRNEGSAGERYGNQYETADVLPPSNPLAGAQNAFAQGLQNGGQAVRDATNQIAQDILPPDSGQRLNNALQRTGQEIGTQIGSDLRRIADSGRNDIAQYFGDNSAPQNSSAEMNEQVLPPTNQSGGSQQVLPGSTPANQIAGITNSRRVDQPINQGEVGRWNGPQGAETTANSNSSNQGTGSERNWPPIEQPQNYQSANRDNSFSGGSAPPYRGNNANVIPPQNQERAASQYPAQTNSTAEDSVANNSTRQSNNEGPSFPAFTPSAGAERDDNITPTPMNTVNNSSVPEIRRGMNMREDAVSENNRTSPQTSTLGDRQPNSTQTTTPRTDQSGMPPENQANYQPTSTTGNPASVFPLLLSWVLLSGSGAGNFYLLWSYLDVRNKYRDLVYDASRKIRGRHSDLD